MHSRRGVGAASGAIPATRLRARLLVALVVTVLACSAALASARPARADDNEPVKVLLLLDVSGSMNEHIASGGSKFAAAKRALKQVAGALPPQTQVGLRVYGSTIAEPKSQNPKACTDTQLVMPVGPLDKATMYRAVDSFSAKGETPIAYSLGKAVDDLGDSGRRVVILISDGEETCAKDPCPTAEKLAKSGVDLQFNAIGLAVGSKARKQLRCIADAGDGSYYDANRTGDLTEALNKITQRALRPFQVSGKPVQGTPEPGNAPELTAGQYTDRYTAGGPLRYYRITRTPGATVTASLASIVRVSGGQGLDSWKIALQTSSGQSCGNDVVSASSQNATTVLAGSLSAGTGFRTVAGPLPPACVSDPQLVLSLQRSVVLGSRKTAPVELVVSEEPPITNLSALPGKLSSYTGAAKAVGHRKPVKRVVGGSAFSNAPTVTAGSWSDSVTVGETVFYRVAVQPGQRLRASATVPAPGGSSGLQDAEAVAVRTLVYAPSRTLLTDKYLVIQGKRRATVTAAGPQVRVRNREADWLPRGLNAASTGGDYYVGVQLDPTQADITGRVVPVRLDVAVDGQPTGLPVYAQGSASASPTPSPGSASPASTSPTTSESPVRTTEPQNDGSSVLPALLIGGAVVVVAGVVVWALRRRR